MQRSILFAIPVLFLASALTAQEQEQSTNRVAAETDWSVFVEDDPTECWAVTTFKESTNTRDGRVVSVRRGDILLFVTFRPGSEVAGEVSFTGGYPFADGSTASVSIGTDSFELFTEGEWAWPASSGDDVKLVNAMKRGSQAVITARSSRGTQTQDTFSLLGFTAALEEAENRCAN
ncbi:MAG: invasion associated locus B family protein [Pseudomonadota bacterium]